MSDPLPKPSDAVGDSSQHSPMTEAGVSTPGLSTGPMSTRRSLSGLTLIELLIAVAVLTVVVMLAYPYYIGIVTRARETAAVAHMSDWPEAQLLYWTDNGHFATSLTQLYDAGFLVPVNSGRIGYSFEITQFTAAAPPRGRTMTAFAAAPAEMWWEGIELVKYAWADGKDKDEEDDEEEAEDDDEEEKVNDGKGEDGDGAKDESGAKDGQGDSGGDDSDGSDGKVADDSGGGTGEGEQSSDPSSEGAQGGGGVGWQGYADPTDEGPRHFYTDHSNEVRSAVGRRATRYDPVVELGDRHKDKNKGKNKGTNKGSNKGKGSGAL